MITTAELAASTLTTSLTAAHAAKRATRTALATLDFHIAKGDVDHMDSTLARRAALQKASDAATDLVDLLAAI